LDNFQGQELWKQDSRQADHILNCAAIDGRLDQCHSIGSSLDTAVTLVPFRYDLDMSGIVCSKFIDQVWRQSDCRIQLKLMDVIKLLWWPEISSTLFIINDVPVWF
jgi:hypothetical protein